MMRSPVAPLLLLLLAVAGCSSRPKALPMVEMIPTVEPAIPLDWKPVATAADLDRLARLPAAWTDGLAAARVRRFQAAVRQEGALLDPEAALPRATLPPGRYRCRVIRLGAASRPKAPAFAAFPPFFCYVETEEALLTLVKETGTQRPSGRLWTDGDAKSVFLGSTAPNEETAAPAYGAEPARDVAGVVERVGPFRWRLVLPWPHGGGALDIIELVPFVS